MAFPDLRVIEAEVFARLPESLRRREPTGWSRSNHHGAPLDSFLEGPSFDRDGNLYVVDITHGRVFRIAPDGGFDTITEYDGFPNGLKIRRDGAIVLADFRNGIMRLDPATGVVTPLCTRFEGAPFKGCNDLVLANDGTIWFTDQGQTGLHDPTGRVFRLRPDGEAELVLGGIPSPNGLVLTEDEKTLFVAVTRSNAVWRVPVLDDGHVGRVGIFLQFSGGIGPDGLALDADGGLAVAHNGLGVVWIHDRRGLPAVRVDAPAGLRTTNLAYGGPGFGQIYITESDTGTVLRATVPVPGRPMHSHRG